MAKTQKNKSVKLSALINERTLLVVLAIVLVICVGVLIFKDNKKSNKLIEPVTVEQTTEQ